MTRSHMDVLAALPFAGMLLGIALLPLIVPRLWEHPAAPFALVSLCAAPVVILAPGPHERQLLLQGVRDYVAFMALISVLYVVAGGIHISGNPRGTPAINVAFLG